MLILHNALIKSNRNLTNKITTNVEKKGSRDLEIISTGDRGETRYGLALDKTLIEVIGIQPPLRNNL